MKVELERSLSGDRSKAQIALPPASFDVDGVKMIISALAELRSAMLPQEPAEFVPPKSVDAVPDPSLTVEPELWEGDVLLHLRDPGLGWLHYALSRPLAKRLGTHLLTLVQRPDISSGKPN